MSRDNININSSDELNSISNSNRNRFQVNGSTAAGSCVNQDEYALDQTGTCASNVLLSIAEAESCPGWDSIDRGEGEPFFVSISSQIVDNSAQSNYGVGVMDVDDDGEWEAFIAGYAYPNMILKWKADENGGEGGYVDLARTTFHEELIRLEADKTVSVVACDVDGDGYEELMLVNSDSYYGMTDVADHLLRRDPISAGRGYVQIATGTCASNGLADVTDGAACSEAILALSLADTFDFQTEAASPYGCYYHAGNRRVYLNTNLDSRPNGVVDDRYPLCAATGVSSNWEAEDLLWVSSNWEAEDAVLSDPGPEFSDQYTGFFGSGWLDGTAIHQTVTFMVTTSATAQYNLWFRYAQAGTDEMLTKYQRLTINGVIIATDLAFPGTGAWDAWGYCKTSVILNSGLNTVELKAVSSKGAHLDRLEVKFDVWLDYFQPGGPSEAETNYCASRSAACVDRSGNGIYGVFVANYACPSAFFELNADTQVMENIAADIGITESSGARGLVTGPITADDQFGDFGYGMSIYVSNERHDLSNSTAPDFFYRITGDAGPKGEWYSETAAEARLQDSDGEGRGVVMTDLNSDGLLDLVVGNWLGNLHLYIQQEGRVYEDAAPPNQAPWNNSATQNVIVADFDNDGAPELFINSAPGFNLLYTRDTAFTDLKFKRLNAGAAEEPTLRGTGAAVADFDGDGVLELLVSHGGDVEQNVSLFKAARHEGNHYIRIAPLTKYGAPARGTVVRLLIDGEPQRQIVVDAGSGYLCQMEPVAHFGLGSRTTPPDAIEIQWPDRRTVTLYAPAIDQTPPTSPPTEEEFRAALASLASSVLPSDIVIARVQAGSALILSEATVTGSVEAANFAAAVECCAAKELSARAALAPLAPISVVYVAANESASSVPPASSASSEASSSSDSSASESTTFWIGIVSVVVAALVTIAMWKWYHAYTNGNVLPCVKIHPGSAEPAETESVPMLTENASSTAEIINVADESAAQAKDP
ncbi:hypothetical protein CYMTET_17556 [Cymbomonas tetramitiformis]|uniref:CBM6 domain-containing protein n=1 Tax=Cymbomonas tetramitiformis TaxID=36881 RepID=A0AAE0G9V2_9CHLO|nr:hypothetical protein CYMTET_17556 [Cymbomonas tetramitiformis]